MGRKLSIGSGLIDVPAQTLCGTSTSLGALAGGRRTALFFLRDAACVLSQAYIRALTEQEELFLRNDTRVIIVVNASMEGASSVLRLEEVPFEVICDAQGVIYERYGVQTAPSKAELGDEGTVKRIKEAYDAGFIHGTDTGDPLRLPAVFVFGADGKASFAYYGKLGDDLPTLSALEEELKPKT